MHVLHKDLSSGINVIPFFSGAGIPFYPETEMERLNNDEYARTASSAAFTP